MDWLSRLFELIPVRGGVDLRCFYGAPWRIEQGPALTGEMPYHVVLGGSAILEVPAGGPPRLMPGDILLLPQGDAHVLHDGSGAPPEPSRNRTGLNVVFSENAGAPLVAAEAGAAVQHVPGNPGAALSRKARALGQRVADRHPHDHGGE